MRAHIPRLVAVVGLAVALIIGVPVYAADSLVLARFADFLESLRSQSGIPAVAAVMTSSSDIAFDRAFGQQDVERSVNAQTFTPFHLDGLTETMTATLVLRCAQEGRISLDDLVSHYGAESDDTIRQVLSHTTTSGAFSYQPQRLDSLKWVVERCNPARSFRAALANMLEFLGMMNDSVPGPDAVNVPASATGIGQAAIDRYKSILDRLAVPYAVDSQKRATKSQYSATGLTASSGLISSARDYARFDLALKGGNVLGFDMLNQAWSAPGGRPHGLGWFVQSYNGEKVVWTFGQSNASSSLVVILPARSITLILLANSDGLSKSFNLSNGDVTTSPFGKLFLELFVK